MREISTEFLEVGEHIVVDGVEYVGEEDAGDCKDCDLHNCGRCFLIPCQTGVKLKRVELPSHGRLIDADKLYDALAGENLPNKVFDEIVNAPTVLEASKERE